MKKIFLFLLPSLWLLSACNFVELSDVDVTQQFEVSQTYHSLDASGDVIVKMNTNKDHYYVTNSNIQEFVHVYQKDTKLTIHVDGYTIWPSASAYYTKVYIPEEHGLNNIKLSGSAQFSTEPDFLDDKLSFNLSSYAKMGTERLPVLIQGNQQVNIQMSGNSVMYVFCNGRSAGYFRGQLRDNARLYIVSGTPIRNDITCYGESAIITKNQPVGIPAK